MNDTTDDNRLKEHFAKYKGYYISAGTGVVAGITLVIMKKNTNLLSGLGSSLLSGFEGSGKVVVDNTTRSSFNFVTGGSTNSVVNNAYTTIHTGGRGATGFVTRSLDTGELFQTQGDAARAFEISASKLSSHLNGKLPNVEGFQFERVGVFE